ncbi:MAG TPA: PQQ-binding-like beta-propeller repeat protein, partial [Gemmatimonadales bacterium]|nr:PQQ-binding-like beta-propeller repeat protein [Gemmatimonadales bacterium]
PVGAGHVIALRRSDGSEAWRYPLPDSAGIFGGTVNGGAVWQDRLIVGSAIGRASALRLVDGALLWEVTNDPHVTEYRARPVILDDVVVFARGDNVVEGRDARTGEQRWSMERPAGLSWPVAVGRYVYVMDGPISMIEADGTVAWKHGGVTFPGGGTSFFRGTVSSDGMIYTLGTTYLTPNEGTFVFALQPPVRP